MEEFVSYEIALKLKERGFNEKCLYHYENGNLFDNALYWDYSDVDAPIIIQVSYWY